MEEIKNMLQAVLGRLEEQGAEIRGLHERMDRLEGRMMALENRMKAIEEKLDNLDKTVTYIAGDVYRLKSRTD